MTPEQLMQAIMTRAGSQYPTADNIMDNEHKHKPSTIKIIKGWKRKHFKGWGAKSAEEQNEALTELLNEIAADYDKPVTVEIGGIPCYQPAHQRIVLNADKPSIITSLHELAHHLFGADETKACRWSVWLFKKAFPRSFANLRFDGHLLVRR